MGGERGGRELRIWCVGVKSSNTLENKAIQAVFLSATLRRARMAEFKLVRRRSFRT